jgi:hypothetical protein
MRGPGETVDGNGILGEVPGDLGLLLWKTAQDVALWGGSPPSQRGKLFAEGSGDGRLAGLVATDVPAGLTDSSTDYISLVAEPVGQESTTCSA